MQKSHKIISITLMVLDIISAIAFGLLGASIFNFSSMGGNNIEFGLNVESFVYLLFLAAIVLAIIYYAQYIKKGLNFKLSKIFKFVFIINIIILAIIIIPSIMNFIFALFITFLFKSFFSA